MYRLFMLIAVLGALGCDSARSRSERAKAVKAMSEISMLASASQLFRMDNGRYAKNIDELMQVTPEGFRYLEKTLTDPWSEKPYLFKLVDGVPHFGTLGADGKEGGEGNDADHWVKSGNIIVLPRR